MEKKIYIFVLSIFVIIFLILNTFFYSSEISFGEIEIEPNFSIGNSTQMQFYPNMRFQMENISYKISNNCDLSRKNDMERAFNFFENYTSLKFYPVLSQEEILINCEDKQISNGTFFIAGEGGPTKIIKSGPFSVILNGEILLLRESSCPRPNVAIHELLHVLGFLHSDNKKNIMYPISDCSQTIGDDLLEKIKELYSYPDKQDLYFTKANLELKNRYANLNFSIVNGGLKESQNETIFIIVEEKIVEEINLPSLEIGEEIEIKMTNVNLRKSKIDKVKLEIPNSSLELSNENNVIILSLVI